MPDMSPAPAPQPTETQPLPMNATPDQFGAGVFGEIAQGAAQAYAGLEQRREIDMKNAVDAQAGAAQVALAQFQARMSDVENAAKGDSRIPANTYQAAILGRFDQDSPALLSGIDNPIVARMVKNQLGEMRARFAQSSGDYQTVALAKQANANTLAADNANDALAGTVFTLGDLRMIQERGADLWHHQPDLTNEQRAMGTIQSAQKQALSYAWGWAQRDGAEAIRRIDNGEFTEAGVPAEQLHVLRSAAMAQVAHAEEQKRAQKAAAKAQFNQDASLFLARAHDGENLSPVEAGALAQTALGFGEEAKAREITRALEDQGFAQKYHIMAVNPVRMQQQIATLAAKPHPNPMEQRELAWAQEHAPSLASRFAADPVAYMAELGQRGAQPPALNLADPQSILARDQWSMRTGEANGVSMKPLAEAEMEPMRKQIGISVQGRLEALQHLDPLPPMRRLEWARAIMPNDKLFQQEAMLAPGVRDLVHSGKIIQEGNQGYWPSNSMNHPDQMKSAQQLANFDAMIANTLRNVDAETVVAVQQNMRNYLAGKFKSQGKANAHQITGADLREAATYAFGGQMKNGHQYGGGMLWREPQGFFVAPENMTGAQFFNAIRADLAAQVKAGHGPVEPNGHDFDLKKATPVFIGNGVYRWETGTGPNASIVLNKKGQPYITRIGGQ